MHWRKCVEQIKKLIKFSKVRELLIKELKKGKIYWVVFESIKIDDSNSKQINWNPA